VHTHEEELSTGMTNSNTDIMYVNSGSLREATY